MKLGIGTYTYMWSIGFPGAQPKVPIDGLGLLRKAHELGVRVVQFGPNLSLSDVSQDQLLAVMELLVYKAAAVVQLRPKNR